MKNSTVINNAPWVTAAGIALLFAPDFFHHLSAAGFEMAGMAVIGAGLGALLTHFPTESDSDRRLLELS